MVTDDIGVKMKYPTISKLSLFDDINEENMFEVLENSIEYVYDQENVYDEFSSDEMKSVFFPHAPQYLLLRRQ